MANTSGSLDLFNDMPNKNDIIKVDISIFYYTDVLTVRLNILHGNENKITLANEKELINQNKKLYKELAKVTDVVYHGNFIVEYRLDTKEYNDITKLYSELSNFINKLDELTESNEITFHMKYNLSNRSNDLIIFLTKMFYSTFNN